MTSSRELALEHSPSEWENGGGAGGRQKQRMNKKCGPTPVPDDKVGIRWQN